MSPRSSAVRGRVTAFAPFARARSDHEAKGGVVTDRDFTQWAAWLESTGIVDQADLDPASIYTNEYNDLAKEGTK